METRIKKFYLRVTIVLLIFVVVTISATFFCIDLPWTAHRASAVKMPAYDYDEYEWFEEKGLYIRDEHLESAL